VQRLQAAKNAGHRLHRDAGNIVQRLLPRQVYPGGLAVKLEAPGSWVLRTEALAREPRPNAPAGPKLGDLLKKAHRNVEKEGEARQHLVGKPTARQAVAGVLNR